MISVVIPYNEDQTYLIRCVNAIRRQTCKDVELLLVAPECDTKVAQKYQLQVIENEGGQPYGGINEAIRKAKGKYLYFCSITSVPAPNTLATLEKAYEADGGVWKYGCCYEEREQGYEACEGMAASYYGRLYELRVIRDNNIQLCESSSFAELQFVVEYAAHMKDMALAKNIYIYETDIQWEHPEGKKEKISPEDWKALLRGINELDEAIAGRITESLCRRLEGYFCFSRELMEITQECSSSLGLNYAVAKPVLKSWWDAVLARQDQEAFRSLKAYLAGYEDNEAYLELLLLSCGIRKELYPYLRNQDLHTALYFMDESSKLKGYVGEGKNATEENASVQVQKLIPAEELFAQTQRELTGTELAEYTVSKYADGRLGLKTVFRSLGAWMKYKL